jgi:hypothetical protein
MAGPPTRNHPCIHASAQSSICVCVGRVWGCVRVRMRGRVREGVWREGKREVRREEGVGKADGVIAGYTWRVCVRVFALVYSCVVVRWHVCVCSLCADFLMCLCACVTVCVCVRACLHLYKPRRGPP